MLVLCYARPCLVVLIALAVPRARPAPPNSVYLVGVCACVVVWCVVWYVCYRVLRASCGHLRSGPERKEREIEERRSGLLASRVGHFYFAADSPAGGVWREARTRLSNSRFDY